MKLVITEKPKVALQMANALSAKVQKKMLDGIAYYELQRNGQSVVVAPAVGHVYSLAEKNKASGTYPVFEVEWVPAFEGSEESAHTKKYLQVLKKLAKEARETYNACDYDVEGSLIGGNVIRFLAKGKPAKRMLFSSLVAEELQSAFDSAGPLDASSISAGETRHMLDWFWGINVSRALMSSLKRAGRFKVLSIGRVQGPALALLAKREREISAFKPEPYWQVFAQAKDTRFLHEKQRFTNEQEAKAVLEACQKEKEGVVSALEVKCFEQPPGVPFDLTTLQVEAYRCFGLSPSRTLEVAQDLYEQALISYPRTSSQKLPSKLNLPKIISQLQQQPPYSELAHQLIQAKRFVAKEGSKTDSAHVSIYPTGMRPGKLGEEPHHLYDLIVRRFLSCFAPSAEREGMKVTLQIASHNFNASGVRTLKQGWTEFYGPYTALEEEVLPSFHKEERVPLQKAWDERKTTQPPKRFTPTSIIRELEKHKLGTKSTRSAVIDTLYSRNYLSDQKSIHVTPLGLSVEEALEKNVPEILSEQLTRKFESEVEGIQQGKFQQQHVLEEGKQTLERLLSDFKTKEETIGKALLKGVHDLAKKHSVLGSCTACSQGHLVIKKSQYGFFAACDRYPECKTTFSLPKNALCASTGKPCEFCGTPVIKVVRKGKRPFEMCLTPTCESKASWSHKGAYGKNKAGVSAESQVVRKPAAPKLNSV